MIAAVFCDLLEEAGCLRASSTTFRVRDGRSATRSSAHPKTRFIAFTGSKEVGLHINELASKTQPGPDLDQTCHRGDGRQGFDRRRGRCGPRCCRRRASRFPRSGSAGEKCSACSRAIVDASVYDAFLEKLAVRVKSHRRRSARRASVYMGPVINEGALDSMLALHRDREEPKARLLAGGSRVAGPRRLVPRTDRLRRTLRPTRSSRKKRSSGPYSR